MDHSTEYGDNEERREVTFTPKEMSLIEEIKTWDAPLDMAVEHFLTHMDAPFLDERQSSMVAFIIRKLLPQKKPEAPSGPWEKIS